jgi:hypothetical protein
MKAITILCFCAFVIEPAFAQNKLPFQKKLNPFNTVKEFSITFKKPQQATLLSANTLGKVYALPIDNMPCLIPHTSNEALMPVYNTPLLYPGIPNPFPKQDLIASGFNKGDNLKFNATPDKEDTKNLLKDYLKRNKKIMH